MKYFGGAVGKIGKYQTTFLVVISTLSLTTFAGLSPRALLPKATGKGSNLESLVERSQQGDNSIRLFGDAGKAGVLGKGAALDIKTQRLSVLHTDTSGQILEIPELNIIRYVKPTSSITKVETSIAENGKVINTTIQGNEIGPKGEYVKFTKVIRAERKTINSAKHEFADEGEASISSATAEDVVTKKKIKAEVASSAYDRWIEVSINDGKPIKFSAAPPNRKILSVKPNIDRTVEVEVEVPPGQIGKYTFKIDEKEGKATQILSETRDVHLRYDNRKFEVQTVRGPSNATAASSVRNLNINKGGSK
jgi:hypothetical protein